MAVTAQHTHLFQGESTVSRKDRVEGKRRQNSLVPRTVAVEGDEILNLELRPNAHDFVPATRLPARHEHPHDLMAHGCHKSRRGWVVPQVLRNMGVIGEGGIHGGSFALEGWT